MIHCLSHYYYICFTCLYFWEVCIMCMYILYTRLAISGMFLTIWSACPEASLWGEERWEEISGRRNPWCFVKGTKMKNYFHTVSSCSFSFAVAPPGKLLVWGKMCREITIHSLAATCLLTENKFSLAASSDQCTHANKRSRGCRVCFIKLACRQSVAA